MPSEEAPPAARRRRHLNGTARLGIGIVGAFAVVAALAPVLAPYDPLATAPARAFEGPGREHLLGTDGYGRDVLSRLLVGSRASLGTAALGALAVIAIGLAVGILAGLRGGWVDALCMRIVDGLLAFPSLILVLAVAGTVRGGLLTVVVALSAVSWGGCARLVRGLVLQLRNQDFVDAARATGASTWSIAGRHILPNVLGPVVVLMTIEMSSLILAVSGLAFLGVGARPPAPEWGAMLNEGRGALLSDARLVMLPGLAITLAVTGFTLLGDGIRDVLDPKGAVDPLSRSKGRSRGRGGTRRAR